MSHSLLYGGKGHCPEFLKLKVRIYVELYSFKFNSQLHAYTEWSLKCNLTDTKQKLNFLLLATVVNQI